MSNDYGIKDVKGRGLQIYTAIDLAAQDSATRILEAGLQGIERGNRRLRRSDPQAKLQGVLIHVHVPSGEIRALVGGRNYDINQFNRALNSKRLVGSLFKGGPFILGAVGCLLGGYWTDALFRRGTSLRWSRRLPGLVGLVLCAGCYLIAARMPSAAAEPGCADPTG